MRKKLIILNGTMGAGKTTLCSELSKKLDYSVWLDGDWCWMMNPWIFSEENKKMVIENIVFILRNYLNNSSYRYVIFDWVMHEKNILDMILERIGDLDYELYLFSLICSEKTLEERLAKRRDSPERISESISRIEKYYELDSTKINTDQSIDMNIQLIKEILGGKSEN